MQISWMYLCLMDLKDESDSDDLFILYDHDHNDDVGDRDVIAKLLPTLKMLLQVKTSQSL